MQPGGRVCVSSEQHVKAYKAAGPARGVGCKPVLPADVEVRAVLVLDSVANTVGELTVVVGVLAAMFQGNDVVLCP